MLTSRYYHVTERTIATQILAEGFKGGWGDVGFGVYTYASLDDALDYAADGGWDNQLEDPVILVIEDDSLEKVEPHPDWDADKYENMYWKPLDDDDEDAPWVPQHLRLWEEPEVKVTEGAPQQASCPTLRRVRP